MYKLIIKAITASMNIFKRLNAEKHWKHELVVCTFKKDISRVAIKLKKITYNKTYIQNIVCNLFRK